MREFRPALVLLGALVSILPLLTGCGIACDPITPQHRAAWTLVWSDEFNGADGSSPDASKWTFDTGGKGWGNNELECYTNLTQNAQVKGGNLFITAMPQPAYACVGRTTPDFTSAPLNTQCPL